MLIQDGVVDLTLLLRAVDDFLGMSTITVSRGTFPLRLPRFGEFLSKIISAKCKEWEKTEGEPLIFSLGEIHYRLYDISGVEEELKQKVTEMELGAMGLPSLRSLGVFNFEVNRAISDALSVIIRPEYKVKVTEIGGGWIVDRQDVYNIKKSLEWQVEEK